MLAIFSKSLESVTTADVNELVAQTWPEGYEVEFKMTLPDKKGGTNPWIKGANEIGEHARDEILAEVIAFANAQGGNVVLGVAETKDKPPRAQAITPVPRVGELARRFEDQARSCIEPPLPQLQVRPIETDGQGGGVIVFRTVPSRAAPHRLTTNLESYVRRGSSTVRMTMREIQDMSLNVARGLAGIAAAFAHRREVFGEWGSAQKRVVAYRITAVPLADLPDPGRIFGRQDIFPTHREFKATVGTRTFDLKSRILGWDERPRIRGIVRSHGGDRDAFQWELHQSGLTDLWIAAAPWRHPATAPTDPDQFALFHSEVLGGVANILVVVDHFRSQVGAPDAEYGIELEVDRFGGIGREPIIYSGLFAGMGSDIYQVQRLPILLPRLAVGPRKEFEGILNVVDTDIYDAMGVRRASRTPLQVSI